MKDPYKGLNRRQFVRLDYVAPLAYKVCKKKTIAMLLKGYTKNISQSGLLCNIKDKPKEGDVLWISFDRTILSICEDLERRCFIYQNGIFGKVIRTEHKRNGTFNVGIQFIMREEKNLTNIYPKIHFLKEQLEKQDEIEDEDADEVEDQDKEEDENQEY